MKLADFGLSKRLVEGTKLNTRAGTESYMAPEIAGYLRIDPRAPSSEYSAVVDLWALGCIVYRLVTGHVPFPIVRNLIDYCEGRFPFPEDELSDMTVKGARFIQELLRPYPKDRPSARQACEHPWIRGKRRRRYILSL